MRKLLLNALLAATLCGPARSQGAPQTAERTAADAVLAAIQAEDDAAVAALAAKEDPDPWLVAAELLFRGEADAAQAFARAAPRPDTETLPAYVASRRDRGVDAAPRDALVAANAELAAGDFAGALRRIDGISHPDDAVTSSRLDYGRGIALRGLSRSEESAGAFLAAAKQAREIGWLARAARAFREAGATYQGDSARTQDAWQDCLAVEEARGNQKGVANMLGDLGVLHYHRAEYAKALLLLERTLRLCEELGNRPGVLTSLIFIGYASGALADYPKALECHERALKLAEELGDRASVAMCLRSIGAKHEIVGASSKALECYGRALKLHEELGDAAAVAIDLLGMGDVLVTLGEWSKALGFLERALTLNEELGDRVGVASTLLSIGNVRYSQGDYPRALDCYQRALRLREELGDRGGMASNLLSIGNVHLRRGDRPNALDCYERSRRLSEQIGDRIGAAQCLERIGTVHHTLGEYSRALDCYERALNILQDLGDRRSAATTLGNMGIVHRSLGDYPRALDCHERALRIQEELGDRANVVRSLGGLGTVEHLLGDYPKALDCYGRALTLAEELGDRAGVALMLLDFGCVHLTRGDFAKAQGFFERASALGGELGDRAVVATALGNIGVIHQSIGDYPRALECFERALKLKNEIGDRAGAAGTLMNISGLHGLLGNGPKAIDGCEQALRVQEELGDRAGMVWTLGNIGSICCGLGDHATALDRLQRALRIGEEIGDPTGIANTLRRMGWVYLSAGDHPKAVDFLERGRVEAERLGARYEIASGLMNLSLAHLARGDPAAALASGRQAVEILGHLATGLSDDQGATVRGQFADVFDVGARAGAALGRAADVAHFLESGRAGALLAAFSTRAAIAADALPEDLREAEIAARAEETRCAAALRRAFAGTEAEAVTSARKELETAQKGVGDVIARIQRTSARVASVTYPKADDLAVIQGRLAAGEALVLYGIDDEESLALVVTAKDARIVALGAGERIRESCGALALDGEGDPTQGIADLRARVVEPLKLGADVKRVLVSPDADLCFVPFALLLPDREVVHEPSGTVYGLLLEDRARKGEGVLALGDPDYRSTQASVLWSGKPLRRLVASGQEAKAIGTVTLLGKDATETRLLEEIAKRPRWRAVHLACHGLVDAENPQRSSLAVAPDGASDGFLSVIDVFRTRCEADLVVLSACQTGKGKVVRGEGLVGLTRAFMFAGSPRVVVSLWKVDDEATRALMTRFYALWNPKDGSKGLPAATALKRAMESVRDDPDHPRWKHPFYWAAWQLWGLP